jgi:hypothetical protein
MVSYSAKKSILVLLVFLSLAFNVSSQFTIDKYGVKLGVGFSSQLWDDKISSFVSTRKDYKAGISALISAEKQLNEFFSVRSELGYVQKGFKNDLDIAMDSSTLKVKGLNVTYHNVAFNLGMKLIPFKATVVPYVVIGLRTDYMLSFKDIVTTEPNSGAEISVYKNEIDKFHAINLSGIVAFGLEYKNMLYIEYEYCPFTTNSYNDASLKIRDLYRSISIGYNLDSFFKR